VTDFSAQSREGIRVKYLPIILLGVLLNAGAQLLLKEGTRRMGYFDFNWVNLIPVSLQAAANPFILGGLASYVISVVVWIMVLSRVDVSFAYPMLSVGYIVNAAAAAYLFQEELSMTRMSGIVTIMAGVYLITRS
jgi:multidrug transporter EmrE-like cation transporter